MAWTEKPPAGTAIDTGHPLYTGLQVCIPMYEGSGTTLYDPKRALSYTLPSASMWDASGGLLIDQDTEYFEVPFDATALDDFTIIIGGYDHNDTSINNNATFISSTNLTQFRMYRTWSRINLLAQNADNRFESLSWNQVSDGNPHNIFCVGKFSTQSAVIYFDGSTNNFVMTLTGTPGITSSTGFYVGGRPSVSGYHMDGIISFLYLYNRQLSTAEIDSLQANPWQIFLDGGGALGELSDGVTASESLSRWAQFSASMSDGATGADSGSKIAGLLGNGTDSIVINDNFISALIASLSDGVSVIDNHTVRANFSVQVSDTTHIAETVQSIKTLIASLSDGISITDISTAYEPTTGHLKMTLTIKSSKISFNFNNLANITFKE